MSQLILQSFRCFTYLTRRAAHAAAPHSPTLSSLHVRHRSFYNHSVASPTSQLILQLFCCFTYVTGTSHTSPGEPPMLQRLIFQPFRPFTYVIAHSTTILSLHLRHSSYYNSSVASPTSQALHIRHQASRPCWLKLPHFQKYLTDLPLK